MRRVLLLNITYEPLTTVALHRAVCLVIGEKADVLHDDSSGEVLHSATTKLAVPSVIRLRRYVRAAHRTAVAHRGPSDHRRARRDPQPRMATDAGAVQPQAVRP